MKLKDFESPELTDADSIVEMVDEGVDDAVGVMVMMSLSSSLAVTVNWTCLLYTSDAADE